MVDKFTVYVIWSKKLKRRYVGMTSNLDLRLSQHNHGTTSYTSKGMPWVLRYMEKYLTSLSARRRELFLKSGAGREFLNRTINGRQGYPKCELPEDCLEYKLITESSPPASLPVAE